MLSANTCTADDECFYEWTVGGETGISVGDTPRLAVTSCYDERCAEGVLDTTGVDVDGATVYAEFLGRPWEAFRLVRSHPSWLYEARWRMSLEDGRRALTIEVKDDETGALLFRNRYEATTSLDDACRPESAIADIGPRWSSD